MTTPRRAGDRLTVALGATLAAIVLALVVGATLAAPANAAPAAVSAPAPAPAPAVTVSASASPGPTGSPTPADGIRTGGSPGVPAKGKPGWVWFGLAALVLLFAAGGFRFWRNREFDVPDEVED